MQSISPIQQAALGHHVAHQLRVLIISGELEPGQHLVEAELAERFDVSRGPIRDALRRLEGEGLLRARRRGLFVVGLHDEDIAELYSLRESLESLAMRRCIERRDEIDWHAFTDAYDAMRDAADRNAAHDYAIADLDFHRQYYRAARHRRLLDVWEQYQPTFTVLVQVTNAQDVDLHPSLESHRQLLELTRSGSVEAALAELSQHLLGSSSRLRAAHEKVRAARQEDA